MSNPFTITRIVGGVLPPRDSESNRLKALEFTLENDSQCLYNGKPARKLWIINRIWQSSFKFEIIKLLDKYDQIFYEIPFSSWHYALAEGFDDKVRAAIEINKARNYGINIARPFLWNILLDDTCFFNDVFWDSFCSDFNRQVENKPNQHYFGIPMVRIFKEIPNNYLSLPCWEPQLAFHKDAKILFDEKIPFGKNDKVRLLQYLGYQRDQNEIAVSGDLCSNAGRVFHVSFEDERQENDIKLRLSSRKKSLELLVNYLDRNIC